MSVNIKRLAELAKLHIEEQDLPVMECEMASIIALMDTLKDVELPPEEDSEDAVSMIYLREDVAGESLAPDRLISQAPDGKFAIPKVVEGGDA